MFRRWLSKARFAWGGSRSGCIGTMSGEAGRDESVLGGDFKALTRMSGEVIETGEMLRE